MEVAPRYNSLHCCHCLHVEGLGGLTGLMWLPYIRVQREFSVRGILDESKLHFFSLDYEKWLSQVSISSRNTRKTICNLVLISKYENGHMIISTSSRQVRAIKIILDLVLKNCTFSRLVSKLKKWLSLTSVIYLLSHGQNTIGNRLFGFMGLRGMRGLRELRGLTCLLYIFSYG